MLIVGLTGGIATGKSSVSTILRDAGWPIIDADIVAREVVEPGTHTLEKLKLVFGPHIIENGILNRQRLGQQVFSNPADLERLNTVIQPAISSAMADKVAFWRTQRVPILVLDVPLLFERGYHEHNHVDKIVVISANPETQLARLKARDNLTDMQAKNRINSQMPLAEKVAQADFVINNDGDKTQLKIQVKELMNELREFAVQYDKK